MSIQHLEKPLKSYRKPSLKKKTCKNTKSLLRKHQKKDLKKEKKRERERIYNLFVFTETF